MGLPTGLYYHRQTDQLFVSTGVISTQRGRVLRYDNYTTLSFDAPANALFGATGYTDYEHNTTSRIQILMPRGLTMDNDENLLVADASDSITAPFFGNNRIVVFENALKPGIFAPEMVGLMGQRYYHQYKPNQNFVHSHAFTLNNPRFMRYEPKSALVYVADRDNNRVVAFAKYFWLKNECVRCPNLGPYVYYAWNVPRDADLCDDGD